MQTSEDMWHLTKETLAETALRTFGKQSRTQNDWFTEYEDELRPYIEAKRSAHVQLLSRPYDTRAKSNFLTAKRDMQRLTRTCVNRYWSNLCELIQRCQSVGDYRGMYQGIKTAIGPTSRKRACIKDLNGDPITEKHQQLQRWAAHYSSLYSEEINVDAEALASLPTFSTLLELDAPPTPAEFQAALNGLKLGKSAGRDNLPAEVIKLKCVSLPLYKILLKCWEEGTIPQDMRDADIVTLYKGKGDRGDCNNYRGISLLSIAGKAFAKVVLKKLEVLAARIYPESQCGFRAGRSTSDMIFTLRQLQEKCREHRVPLYMAFVDLNKAFDTVSRQGLYDVLVRLGCPPTLLSLIRAFHENMKGTVMFDGDSSAAFDMRRGVRQGCVLAPTLFGIFFSALLRAAFDRCDVGVHLHTRKDGKLFNINLLKSTRKRYDVLARELLYADDAALVANSEEELQELINRFSHACRSFSMSVNTKKTVIMVQGTNIPTAIALDQVPLQSVDHFCYLGSTTTSNLCNNREIDTRIGRAATTFGKLSKRVWTNNRLTMSTKVHVYQACVLSILLYASETWTTYSKQERRLNAFHMRCLRIILGVTWRDRVTNEAVLSKTNCYSITAMLKQRRLRWLGHVHRMDPDRLPREVMLGQIAEAKRPVGRPVLRFKDSCKRDMNGFSIPTNRWEERAEMRPEWRRNLREGMAKHDELWLDHLNQKRIRRAAGPPQESRHICDRCGKKCRSAIGLYSHRSRCRL
ncbi:uncharacterized protein LOC134744961 [Cydia strobilella]|uniref:uncharacterized protein LOC134744961 n=1 Tax=Cydia strobilella TaxID=1100964 RepID=UPI003003AAA7